MNFTDYHDSIKGRLEIALDGRSYVVFYDGGLRGAVNTPSVFIAIDKVVKSTSTDAPHHWLCEVSLLCVISESQELSEIKCHNFSKEVMWLVDDSDFIGSAGSPDDIESDWADFPQDESNGYVAREVRFTQELYLPPDGSDLVAFETLYTENSIGGEDTVNASDLVVLDQE